MLGDSPLQSRSCRRTLRWVTDVLARGFFFTVGLFVAGMFGGGCMKSAPPNPIDASTEADDGGAAEGCSTGPPVTAAELVRASPPQAKAMCVPHCGELHYGNSGAPFISALPSGTCAHEGEVCAMAAEIPVYCAGVYAGGAADVFNCTCQAGMWSCGRVVSGGVEVSCPNPDQ